MTPDELERHGYRAQLFAGTFVVTCFDPSVGRYVRVAAGPPFRPKMKTKKFRQRHPEKWAALVQNAWAAAAAHFVARRVGE
jgi:hypothetical protein